MIIDYTAGAINQIPTIFAPAIWSWSGIEGVALVQVFKLAVGQSRLDGATEGQSHLFGALEGQGAVDGAIEGQAEPT